MKADLVLFNGRAYTMDPACPLAQAVAVAGHRILAVGGDDEIRSLLRPGGAAIDLCGRAAIPGLIDSHVHFGWYSISACQHRVELDNVPGKAEALALVAAATLNRPSGEWILGSGWNQNVWTDSSLPTAADLDAVSPDHPVALQDKSHHAMWVNTRALELARVTSTSADPAGGEVVRGPSGEPTGMLLETAAELVQRVLPQPNVGSMAAALRMGIGHAHRLGLTGVHDPGHPVMLSALQMLHSLDELSLRVLVHIPADGLEAAVKLGVRSGFGDRFLRLGGVKLFADGALGPQTAHMLAPYEGSAGHKGIPTLSAAELQDLVRQAHAAGLSVAIHAIGDAANRSALDAIQAATNREPRPSAARGADALLSSASRIVLPDRIEHVQLLDPADLPRLAALGVVASMQPIHATSDMDMAERHWGRRCDLAYAWRSVLESGADLCFGSDCPIETMDPLPGIHAAVTRRRTDGRPGPSGWVPSQRITVTQAVHAYTQGAAKASGEAQLKGSISPGKLADVTVLSRDIFRIAPAEILETRVDVTCFDGRVVFVRDQM